MRRICLDSVEPIMQGNYSAKPILGVPSRLKGKVKHMSMYRNYMKTWSFMSLGEMRIRTSTLAEIQAVYSPFNF